MPSKQLIHPVDIETVELKIFSPETPNEVVEQFYRFGQILFSECLQRGSEVDRKLISALGWSTAALAVLLLHQSKLVRLSIVGVLATLACVSALACVVLASIALRSRMWPAPSEQDWFRDGLWEDCQRMKRYHVVSLLLSHQEHVRRIARKADYLKWIEILLPISAISVGVILLFS